MGKTIDIDQVVEAYIECALWNSVDGDFESLEGRELSEETKLKMREDCRAFIEKAESLLIESGLDDGQIGHDFWLTRNRQGAGFWDRGLGETGRKLTEKAREFHEVDLYVGDDGLVYA
jgi:hypothetical protein